MKNKLIVLGITCSGLLFVAGCYVEHSRGSSRGPAVNTSYTYVYYPDAEVYFEPRHRVYYWSDDGRWRSGASVPHNIVLRSHVTVTLDSPEPYKHHAELQSKYPRHQQQDEHDQGYPDHDQH